MASLNEDLRKLRKLKKAADDAQDRADQAKTAFKEWERHCLSRYEAEDVQSHNTSGTNFVRVETVYPVVQDRDEFVRWAEENDPSLIEPRELKGRLGEIVREKLDNGDILPPGLGFYIKEYISQRAG